MPNRPVFTHVRGGRLLLKIEGGGVSEEEEEEEEEGEGGGEHRCREDVCKYEGRLGGRFGYFVFFFCSGEGKGEHAE